MKFRGSLLNHTKLSKKKLEVLANIQADALREGISSIRDLDNKLNSTSDYIAPILFPLNELTLPTIFNRELNESLTEARSVAKLSQEYIDSLVNLQEETYLGVTALTQDWFSVQQQVRTLTTYEKYLHRSIGPTVSILPLSFFLSPENPLPSVFPNCHTTLSNQLTLPIEKRNIFPIRRVDIYGYGEDNKSSLDSRIQTGPFLFRATTNIEPENIQFHIELEQEEQINHLRIPCILPLPVYLESIQLLDSSNRQTRIFTSNELRALTQRVPVALELIFPPTPVRSIRIKFQDKLDTKKIGLTTEITLNEIEANLSPILAKNIELLDARGLIQKKEMEKLLHDSFGSFKTILTRQNLNSIKAWYTVLGIILECSLTEFSRSGQFNTHVYSDNNVVSSAFRATGKLIDHNYKELSLSTNTTEIPITFVNLKVIKTALDEKSNMVNRIYVTHPLSRPFNNYAFELLTAQSSQDRKTEAQSESQVYSAYMYSDDPSLAELYIPTLKGPVLTSGFVTSDNKTRIVNIQINNSLLEDLIIKYPITTASAPNLGTYSESRPYFISPLGSVVYKPDLFNIKYSDIHISIEMHRVEYTNLVTPVLDAVTLLLGHKANKRSSV